MRLILWFSNTVHAVSWCPLPSLVPSFARMRHNQVSSQWCRKLDSICEEGRRRVNWPEELRSATRLWWCFSSHICKCLLINHVSFLKCGFLHDRRHFPEALTRITEINHRTFQASLSAQKNRKKSSFFSFWTKLNCHLEMMHYCLLMSDDFSRENDTLWLWKKNHCKHCVF